VSNLAVLLLGIWLIITAGFTPGALLAFQGFLGSFMGPVTQLIGLGTTIQETQTEL
jgi:ABC-type bacteriocin/lantibiotic exporter with double-glycine peptidase domain